VGARFTAAEDDELDLALGPHEFSAGKHELSFARDGVPTGGAAVAFEWSACCASA